MNTNNNVYLGAKRGSILAYSLIILAMMLAIAASISVVTVVQKKSSGETEFSAQAYQTADSGAQLTYKALVGISDRTKTINTAFSCNASGVVKDLPIDSINGKGGTYDLVFYSDIPGNVQITDCSTAKISDIKSIKSIGYYMNTVRAIAVVVAEIEYIYVGIGNYKDMCIVDVTNPALPIFKKSISNMSFATASIPASEERRFPVMFNSADNKKYIYSFGDQAGSGAFFFSANVSDDPMLGSAAVKQSVNVKTDLSSGFGQAGFAAKFPFLISDDRKWLLVPSSYPVTSAPVSKFEINSSGSLLGPVDNTLKIKTSSSNNLVYGVDLRDPYLYADSQGYLLIYNFLTGVTVYDHVGGADDLATKTANRQSILKISQSGERLFAVTPFTGDVHVLDVSTKISPVYKSGYSTGLTGGTTMVAVANNKSDDYVYVAGTGASGSNHITLVAIDAHSPSSLSKKTKSETSFDYTSGTILRDIYIQNDHLYIVTDTMVAPGKKKTVVEIYDISGSNANDPQYLGKWESKNAPVTSNEICN